MKKHLTLTASLVGMFALGFALKSWIDHDQQPNATGRATSIGGIFFTCKNPKAVREWYKQHLGLQTNDYGAVFEWRQARDSSRKGFTQWSPMGERTSYMAPSDKPFMINYRVTNLEALLLQLRKDSVTILDSVETVDYGKFVHLLDLEGNKVELWEPNDAAYEALGRQMGATTTK